MMQEIENRSHYLKIRLKPSEYELIQKRCAKSSFTNPSEFCRALLLGKPVTILYRDKSMDTALEELVLLRQELNAVGNNLNQAVKNINAAHGHADSRLWIGLLTVINGKLEPAVTAIKERIAQYADLWLQRSKAAKA